MTRRNIGTAPAGMSIDTDTMIAEFWTRDATGRAAMIDDVDTSARAAHAAGDTATALDLMGVSVALRSETVNPYTEANTVYTYMMIAARMMDTMSPAARSIIDRAGANVIDAIIDRVGDPHRAPADQEVSSGQTYGTGKSRRAVGPWVRAAIATAPGTYFTHAAIAKWAMSIDPATGDINAAPYGLTRTETGLTGRIGAWVNGKDAAASVADGSIMIGYRDGTAAIMAI